MLIEAHLKYIEVLPVLVGHHVQVHDGLKIWILWL